MNDLHYFAKGTSAGEHNSNCHIQAAFPPNRLETAEHPSKLTGQMTIIKEQVTAGTSRQGLCNSSVAGGGAEQSRVMAIRAK